MSNLDRPMHRSQWVKVAHSSFIEASHTTKNTASRSVNDASRSIIDDSRVMLQIVAFDDRCDIHEDHKYGSVSMVRNAEHL